jgi:hypothetical protein
MPTNRTSPQSRKERTGIDRLYKRVGVRKVAFYYQHPDGTSETLGVADTGDRKAIADAERTAMRKALDIQQGKIIAGSVAEMIERFRDDIAPTHYRDQSKDGLAVRASAYAKLIAAFGAMKPSSLCTQHGYQYIDARAKAGAPAKAKKELSQMSTICHYGVRWGVIKTNPFVDMLHLQHDKKTRKTQRSQIVQFYLWGLRQAPGLRIFGCAAMFTYLTGFRAAEVRPMHISGICKDGVRLVNAKRKKGEEEVTKLREWSPRLRAVVERAKRTHKAARMYLFANQSGQPYTRSGWGSQHADAMYEWIASFDADVAEHLAEKKRWEKLYRAAYKAGETMEKYQGYKITTHQDYFALQDIRPAAITTKLKNRDADAYDFAAHKNQATTHKHYDNRMEKKARATE